MQIIHQRIEGLKLVLPDLFPDERGKVFEGYRESRYLELDIRFVQDNFAQSSPNVLRGLHYQESPEQAKLITCLQGSIYDVAVDIRPFSSTFGQWMGFFLDDQTHAQLFIPSGFAHGYCVIGEKKAWVHYKVSSPYTPLQERSIRWNDPSIGIEWPLLDPIVSMRDRQSPLWEEVFG